MNTQAFTLSANSEWQDRIAHMRTICGEMLEYIEGHTKESFSSNKMALRAAERCFEILGEAAKKIPAHIRDAHPEIAWNGMTGLRNVIAHDYFKMRIDVLWQTIKRDIPPLVSQLDAVRNGAAKDEQRYAKSATEMKPHAVQKP